MSMDAMTCTWSDDGVARITIDLPDRPVNTLGAWFADELDAVLDRVEEASVCRGVVFLSGKEDSFVVGADLEMIRDCDNADEIEGMSRRAQEVLARLSALNVVTACAIHGTCFGLGLELAMACDLRVVSDDRSTRLGQPEVKLGLLPGAGGTQRLPALVALPKALELLLTGKSVSAVEAVGVGLVHEACPRPLLDQVVDRRMVEPRDQEVSALSDRLRKLAEESRVAHRVILDRAGSKARAKTRGNYPAPDRILEVVETGLRGGMEAGLAAERKAFGELAVTPESRELVRLFFVDQALKKEDWGVDDVEPAEVERIAVVGGGLMGAGIAQVSSREAGAAVRLKDVSSEPLVKAMNAIGSSLDDEVSKGKLTDFERQRAFHRIGPTSSYRGFRHCKLVIEAVFEDLELKHQVLGEIEQHGPEDVIVASNTSAIPVARLAEASRRPERLLGMHYFSPVPEMPLLEIVAGPETSDEVLATCVAFGRAQGKKVIVVDDGPGFYTTRILAAFMNEAFHLYEQGADILDVDGGLEKFGFPLGPFQLADEVGLDVAQEIEQSLEELFAGRLPRPSVVGWMVERDRLGKKNGKGFYRGSGSDRKVDPAVADVPRTGQRARGLAPEEMGWRCVLRMIDEAVRCYADGVLRSARDGDAGAVFGLGYPPFRGGPFRTIKAEGAATIVTRMREHGMDPCELLVVMAEDEASVQEAKQAVHHA